MSQPTCSTCAYFYALEGGHCRFDRPAVFPMQAKVRMPAVVDPMTKVVIAPERDEVQTRFVSAWPPVSEHGFCGHHPGFAAYIEALRVALAEAERAAAA